MIYPPSHDGGSACPLCFPFCVHVLKLISLVDDLLRYDLFDDVCTRSALSRLQTRAYSPSKVTTPSAPSLSPGLFETSRRCALPVWLQESFTKSVYWIVLLTSNPELGNN